MGGEAGRAAAFGQELRRRRLAAGFSQRQLAEALMTLAGSSSLQVGADGNQISRWERGTAIPRPPYPDLLCQLLGATPEQLGLRVGLPSQPNSVSTKSVRLFEPTMKIVERMRRAGSSNVSNAALDQLDRVVVAAVDEYERLDPLLLVPRLIDQRTWVETLLDGRQTLRQRARLYRVAAQMSGLLGALAVDRGKADVARAYCDEAFQLADLVEDDDLRAWVRATQALTEYYAGCYADSLALAVDGLRYGTGGSQESRLLAQGQARAAAKLGDGPSTRAALARARDLACPRPIGVVSSCMDLDGYCAARLDGNAATALLSLGDVTGSRQFARAALARFDAAAMAGPRSLTRLDIAMTYLTSNEPDRAAQMVIECLDISAARPIATVTDRTAQFLDAGQRFAGISAMRELTERVADLRNVARPALPQDRSPRADT